MSDKIELSAESVRGRSHAMVSEAEYVRRLGKQVGANVHKHSKGDFGKQLDDDLHKCVEKMKNLGVANQEQTRLYAQRLDETVKAFEQTEQAQLDTLMAVRAVVSEASDGQAPASHHE